MTTTVYSGRFQIEQVACMLSEIGHSSVADDLRTGKASLTQTLDIFSSPDSVRSYHSGALHMNFILVQRWDRIPMEILQVFALHSVWVCHVQCYKIKLGKKEHGKEDNSVETSF
jgi:hypothetical protein